MLLTYSRNDINDKKIDQSSFLTVVKFHIFLFIIDIKTQSLMMS